MVQYLLNATAIWLTCLITFDVFLRRESFHQYNRFYLLFTFVLGTLLPLWQWQSRQHDAFQNATLGKPVASVATAKQAIISATSSQALMTKENLFIIMYCIGAVVTLILLAKDILKMLTYYRAGRKSKEGIWTVVETEQEHTPFSFIHTLFVSSRQRYSSDEWQMLLAHEQRHTRLWHVADLLLMQLSKILFWFHPLVYAYYQRLILVHEYQADKVQGSLPGEYSNFLLEQALLPASPSISNSFNRSPIKSRIKMMLKKSTSSAKMKTMVIVPVVILCIAFFSKTSFSQNPKTSQNEIIAFGIPEIAAAPNKNTISHTTFQQILHNPTLVCKDPDAIVTGFQISFLPKGRDFYGPFTITGSNKLQGVALDRVREFAQDDTLTARVFIESIKIQKNGKEAFASSIFLKASNK